MDLEKLKQEAEALQNIDVNQITPDQLTALVDKLSSLLEQSEQSLISTTLIELNKPEENATDNSWYPIRNRNSNASNNIINAVYAGARNFKYKIVNIKAFIFTE